MGRLSKYASISLAALLTVACILMMLLPAPVTLASAWETFPCTWADGSVTVENCESALKCFFGIDANGDLTLERAGTLGTVSSSAQMKSANAVLQSGSLLALNLLDTGNLNSLERTALYREYAATVYYVQRGAFRYNGTKVVPDPVAYAERVILLDGGLPAHCLADMGASELVLRAAAKLDSNDLAGSHIEKVTAELPYSIHGGAIYLETPGGRRLIAALPNMIELSVESCAFADRGALLACTKLERLTLPFIGSSFGGADSGASGQLFWLFQTSSAYTMPKTLTSVTVMGGTLVAYAFYGCTSVTEITACGVMPENIAPQAFLGASDLKYLHTPQSDVVLEGNFTSHIADCGCTIFEKLGDGV